ncbi:DUF1403 family protein (plasmid) [Methylocystis sp. MJC1]|uniref:DUF1403 family protein n=1 Tax=Methylocystis sp. MJC1 TaxID=2654282 RepID=UPI0013E9BFA7|nr:DUF1403 family protein [Methylocystis sp. MJC1]KAF2991470.1 hypothetical protein MJC1_01458 [Methylocystis sp. MJC1]MBU6529400.1 DUF1403 family protein [Methylocystis sp. MJC1]UZX14134.1 DUF1403 family protein [Methylocystis sp. MJC1]
MTLVDSDPTPDVISATPSGPKRARRAAAPAAVKHRQIQPLPRWARPQKTERDAAAFVAGAGLAFFDQILRGGACGADVSSAAQDPAEPVYAGCLRQRLALRAAESCATLCRLREDAGALRDAEHLAGGSETSPAGRIHRLFRLLAGRPARFEAATLAAALSLLGLSASLDVGSGAKALQSCVADAPDPLAVAARASAVAMKLCAAGSALDAEIFALWIADLALANRLDWSRPVPLLAVAILHPSLRRGLNGKRPRPSDEDWLDAVAVAYGLAVAEAHALAADLARRTEKLTTVAPSLRARGAGRVVDMVLADDGVTPAAAAARVGMSDRAARRLFDRLVALGAVRELTGRETFRIYGL